MTFKLLGERLDKRIIFRLNDEMFRQVKHAIKNGKAKTKSELMRKAVQEFLKEVD